MLKGAHMGAGSVGSASRPSLARGVNSSTRAGSRPGTELVGRRDELAILDDELGRAITGEFRVVLLQGEAGTGKSRLGRELLRRHREVTGLVAQGYPLAASAAFGLWTEAIDPFLQSLPDDEVVELCEGLLDDLASLFRRIALVRGALPERDPPLPRLLQSLTGLVGNVARRAPLAVLLDDVHLADPSSWEALRHLARHLDDARLLVIATSRPGELAAHDVAVQVLFELEQDDLLSRMEVPPLGRVALAELAEAVVGHPVQPSLVGWVAERSQGNPLFAIGLLRALIEEQGDLAHPRLHRLPEGLTERVTSELRRFDGPQREILELLAVVGRPVGFGDVAALSGGSLDEVGPILSELVSSGMVVEEERGSELSYEVHHPLVSDVIYDATGGARRRVLHRQAARSLQRGGHLAEAALHFARSAERGDSEAVDVLLDAMRQAERREAYREADVRQPGVRQRSLPRHARDRGAAAEEAWGVRVGNIWGMSEGGCAGIPCEEARTHLSEDLVIIEPVDEQGHPVAPGERAAKVYLTNLFNPVLPLIRYEITDEVTILTEPCPCGSAHRCVADIQGRLDDVFVYDGRPVHPHVFRSALSRRAGIVEYQVRQTLDGAEIAVRCGAPVDLDGLRGEIALTLASLGLSRPIVEIEVAERLQRDPGPAKLRRFVPLEFRQPHSRDRARSEAQPVLSAAR